LQEEFIDTYLNLLLENVDGFNEKLMDYLVWYNTERPHGSLSNLTPINFLLIPLYSLSLQIKCYQECQMYVTYTGT
jgi:hypothetical protein